MRRCLVSITLPNPQESWHGTERPDRFDSFGIPLQNIDSTEEFITKVVQ
jgi:hypothetical protein